MCHTTAVPVMEEVQKGKTPLEDPPEAEPRLKGVRVLVNIVVLLALVGGAAPARVAETGIMVVVVEIVMSRAQAARRSLPVSSTPISKEPIKAQQSCT